MTDFSPADQARAALANPYLRPDELQAIAARHRELWIDVARHPAAYPALLGWMRQYGDDAVRTAIATRGQPHPAPPATPPYQPQGWQTQPAPIPQYPAQPAPPQQYPAQPAPPQQYATQAVPPQAVPPQAIPPQAIPQQQYPTQATPPQQYPAQAAPPQQYATQTVPPQQYPAQTVPPQQYPAQAQSVRPIAETPADANRSYPEAAAPTSPPPLAEPESSGAAEAVPGPVAETAAAAPTLAVEPVDVAPASPQPDTGVEPETDTVATPDTVARPMEFGQTAQDDPFARQTPAVALPEHPQALPGQESLPRIAAGPTESVSADSPPVGARFSTSTAATPPLPQAQPTPFYPGTPQPGWPTPTAEQMGSTPTHALPPQAPTVTSVPFGQPPKKRNTKLIAIIGGGGVLLLAVIVLVFWLGGPGGGSPGALSLTYNQFGYLAEESSLAETDYGPFSVNSDLQRIEALLQSMEVEDEFRGHPQLFAESKQSSMPMSLVLFDNAVNAEKLQTAYAAHFLTQSGTQVTLDETVDSVRLWSATDDNSGTSGRSLAYGNVLAFAMDSEDGTQAWKDFGLKEFKVAVDEAAASPALGGTVAPNPGIATPTTQPPSGNTAPASSGKLTFTGEADFPQCDDFYATFVLSADRKSVSEVELVAYGPKGDDLNIDKLTQSSSGSFDVDDDGHVLVTLGNGTKLDVTINGDTATGSVSFVFTTQGVGNTNGVALDFGEQPITLTGK